MRKLLVLLLLVGCATPLDHMSPDQISSLPNQEICYWANLGDTVAVPEANRRGLVCRQSTPSLEVQNIQNKANMYDALATKRHSSYKEPRSTRLICKEQYRQYSWQPVEIICED